MCMFCAAVPVAGAVGAKLNVEQNHRAAEGKTTPEKPIAAITTGVIVMLLVGSVIYHATMFGR